MSKLIINNSIRIINTSKLSHKPFEHLDNVLQDNGAIKNKSAQFLNYIFIIL